MREYEIHEIVQKLIKFGLVYDKRKDTIYGFLSAFRNELRRKRVRKAAKESMKKITEPEEPDSPSDEIEKKEPEKPKKRPRGRPKYVPTQQEIDLVKKWMAQGVKQTDMPEKTMMNICKIRKLYAIIKGRTPAPEGVVV
jgi:hypothetical protein